MFKKVNFNIGFIIILLLLLATTFASFISNSDPYHIELSKGLAKPEWGHLFGFDKLGRDILSRALAGARISLLVGFSVVIVSVIIGTLVGAIAGYAGGVMDEVIMRITDIFLAFPGILLAIGLMSVLKPSVFNIIIALSAFGWVGYARLVRSQILSLKERDFVVAAVAQGSTNRRIFKNHLLTNIISSIIIEASFGVAGNILAEAGLSFLGLGIQPPHASWGSMIAEGRNFLLVAPHLTLYPGLLIAFTVMGLNLMGDGIRDFLDPNQ